MSKTYGFTPDKNSTIVIFQNRKDFEKAKIANPDMSLVTVIGKDDLKDFDEIVITETATENNSVCETERIVNIGELERKIQTARIHLIAIKEAVTDDDSLKNALTAVIDELYECENFDFLLEHRKVIRKSWFETAMQQGKR